MADAARFRQTARRSLAVWAKVGPGVLLAALAGCGDPAIVSIARGDSGEPGRPSRGPRERPSVIGGELRSDRGSPLRGVAVEADLGLDFEIYGGAESAREAIGTFFDRLATELGLSAFEVYLESWHLTPGARAALADVLVEESARAGLYLIFGPGSGPTRDGMGGTGWFDAAFISAFWDFYAPRYAHRTHVVYQLQKVPDRTCNALWDEPALELERSVYTLIRAHAPETHVLLFSFAETPTAAAFSANVEAVGSAVDWQNASVAFHAHDECAPIGELATLPRDWSGGRIALMATELPPTSWQANLRVLEENRVGWMHFHWVSVEPDVSTFRGAHDQAGITWCPDFGSWPMDSSTCGAP